mmetsp:Transcript_23218/g.69543  ORF Transcript_23218/g.69543 Transcript_23218/m.69543 type:complete len:476 (-) Transcript_23218:8-1435(-)
MSRRAAESPGPSRKKMAAEDSKPAMPELTEGESKRGGISTAALFSIALRRGRADASPRAGAPRRASARAVAGRRGPQEAHGALPRDRRTRRNRAGPRPQVLALQLVDARGQQGDPGLPALPLARVLRADLRVRGFSLRGQVDGTVGSRGRFNVEEGRAVPLLRRALRSRAADEHAVFEGRDGGDGHRLPQHDAARRVRARRGLPQPRAAERALVGRAFNHRRGRDRVRLLRPRVPRAGLGRLRLAGALLRGDRHRDDLRQAHRARRRDGVEDLGARALHERARRARHGRHALRVRRLGELQEATRFVYWLAAGGAAPAGRGLHRGDGHLLRGLALPLQDLGLHVHARGRAQQVRHGARERHDLDAARSTPRHGRARRVPWRGSLVPPGARARRPAPPRGADGGCVQESVQGRDGAHHDAALPRRRPGRGEGGARGRGVRRNQGGGEGDDEPEDVRGKGEIDWYVRPVCNVKTSLH